MMYSRHRSPSRRTQRWRKKISYVKIYHMTRDQSALCELYIREVLEMSRVWETLEISRLEKCWSLALPCHSVSVVPLMWKGVYKSVENTVTHGMVSNFTQSKAQNGAAGCNMLVSSIPHFYARFISFLLSIYALSGTKSLWNMQLKVEEAAEEGSSGLQ